ncbi:E3 ubiquitin-protein ligase [Martiniozyma asiatica (nom. inval.)]|nr:E3 ubiquitin-protein ligase [Martiniozyma asiatica]
MQIKAASLPDLSGIAETDYDFLNQMVLASNNEMAKLMQTQYPKVWDGSRPNLKYYIPLLNKIDTIFEDHINKYKLNQDHVPLLEVPFNDSSLVITCLEYTYHILEYSENRGVYDSHDRVKQLISSTSLDVKLAALKLMCCIQERFLPHQPMKYQLDKKGRETLLRLAKCFPPSIPVPLLTPTPIRVEIKNDIKQASPKKVKKIKKHSKKGQSSQSNHASLVDCLSTDFTIPQQWKSLNFEYYKTANTTIESKGKNKKSSKTETVTEGLHFFKLHEDNIKKFSYQQIFDKASLIIPKNRWSDFYMALYIAKSYASGSFENILMREKLVTLKCLSLAAVSVHLGHTSLTSAVFDEEPYLLAEISELINPDNKVPRECRLSALRFFVNVSGRRTGASELMRTLGGNVSHGLLFHILKTILKQTKDGNFHNDQTFLNYFYNILANILENRQLAEKLRSAGLMKLFLEFLALRNDYRMTRSGPLHLIEIFTQTLPEATDDFVEYNGFQILIDLLKFEVDFSIENPNYNGGAPKKPEFSHIITARQVKLLTFLLKLVLSLVESSSGDRIRNLYDSPIQNSLIKILQNPKIFGNEMIGGVIRIMTCVINNEPTSFTIFKESGLIDTFFEAFETLLLPDSDVLLDITDAVNAVSLNSGGLQKVVESKTIPKLIGVLYKPDLCKILSVNADVSHFGLAIDELSRHHPELKEIIDEEILSLINKVPSIVNFDDIDFYTSPNGSLYTSRDEKNIHNEKNSSELIRWEKYRATSLIQCNLMFLSSVFENSKSWKSLFSKINMKNLFKFIAIDNAPFDYCLSQSAYHFRSIIRSIDQGTSCYCLRYLCEAIAEKLKLLEDFINYQSQDTSYFAQFDSKNPNDVAKAKFTLSQLGSVNSLCYVLSEVYGKYRPQRMGSITEIMSSDDGLMMINNLCNLFKRLSFEEVMLHVHTPHDVAGNAFTPVQANKKYVIASEQPEESDYDGTSAKFKNSSIMYFHFTRIKLWLRTIFNGLTMSTDRRDSGKVHGMNTKRFVQITKRLVDNFIELIASVDSESLEIRTGVLICMSTQLYEMLCVKISAGIHINVIMAICLLENSKFMMLQDLIVENFTLLSTFNSEEIKKWSEKEYTSIELESSVQSLLDQLLAIHQDLASWRSSGFSTIGLAKCYAYLSDKPDYVNEVGQSIIVQAAILNFIMLQKLLSEDGMQILDNMAENISTSIGKRLIDMSAVAWKECKQSLFHLGRLYPITPELTCPSDDKIQILVNAGLESNVATEILIFFEDSLDRITDANSGELEEHFSQVNSETWESVLSNLRSNMIKTPEFQPIQFLTDDDISISNVDDLNFRRGAHEDNFIHYWFEMVELYPDLAHNIYMTLRNSFDINALEKITLKLADKLGRLKFDEASNKKSTVVGLLNLCSDLVPDLSSRSKSFPAVDMIVGMLAHRIKSDNITKSWFAPLLKIFVSILSSSAVPCPESGAVEISNKLPNSLTQRSSIYQIDSTIKMQVLDCLLSIDYFESFETAQTVAEFLLLATNSPTDGMKLGGSKVIKCFTLYMKDHSHDDKLSPLVISLLRRTMESRKVIENYFNKDVNRIFSDKRKKRGRDLKTLISEMSTHAMREAECFVDSLTSDTYIVDAADPLKSTYLLKLNDSQKEILDTAPDFEEDLDDQDVKMVETETDGTKNDEYVGIVHFLLSELKELSKADLSSNLEKIEIKTGDKKDDETTNLMNLMKGNKNFSYALFLMKTLAELLFSYGNAKAEFLTFSKKTSGPELLNKPRSTALNMLVHRFITINPFENVEAPESTRRMHLSKVASVCIMGLISTVPVKGLDYTDSKVTDPDVTFARKFTVDILIKVISEAESSKKSALIKYGKIVDILDLINNIFMKDFGKTIALSVDALVNKHDHFYLAKELIDHKFPSIISNLLAALDVNFPYTEIVADSILKCLTKFGKIKVDYQETLREGAHSIEADDEMFDDDDDADDDDETPDLLKNSTLGMFDMGDVEDEDEFSDFDSDFLNDEDIEIVINSDDENMDENDDIEFDGEIDDDEDIVDADDVEIVDMNDIDEIHSIDDENLLFEDRSLDEDDEGIVIYSDGGSDDDSGDSELDDSDENIIEADSEFGDISDELSSEDEILDDGQYVLDLVTDSDENDDVGEIGDIGSDFEALSDNSDDDSIILDEWLENHENRNRRTEGRSLFTSLNANDIPPPMEMFSPVGETRMPQDRQHPALSLLNNAMMMSVSSTEMERDQPMNDLRRLFEPMISKKSQCISIKSTFQRWEECTKLYHNIGYALRTFPDIVNKLYAKSHMIHEEETKIQKKIEERKRKEKEERLAKQKKEAEEREERERQRERERARQEAETQDQPSSDPIFIEIGGRSIDISGTGIDPEFLLALPEDMREEVYVQHLRQSRWENTSNDDVDGSDHINSEGGRDDDIDEDGEGDDDDDDDDDDEISDDEIPVLDASGNLINGRLSRLVRHGFQNHNFLRYREDNSRETEENKKETKDSKKKFHFTALVDKSSIASLLKLLFVPQLYNKRQWFFQTASYICLNKQNRAEFIAIILYILQESLKDQISLRNVYHQICLRASAPANGDKKVSKDAEGGAWSNFPVNCTTLTVATQAIDVLQYLMENETVMRFHFLSDQDGLPMMKKLSKKNKMKDNSYKFPINILLNLLDNKLIKEDTNLMDILTRTIQIATRPLPAMKEKIEEMKSGSSKKKPQLPVVPDKVLKQVMGILVADECASKVFQQTIASMQNLSVLDNARVVYPKDLSKKATHLSSRIARELRELVCDLKQIKDDDDIPSLGQFSSSSSDQAKLLRVLTALDYIYQNKTDNEELKTLYRNSALGPLWGALSDCLKFLREDENKNFIAFILSPLIEALMVVCKHSKVERMKPIDVLQYEEEKHLDFTNEPIESLFFSFTEEHKKILNHMIRNNPKLMSGPFSVLIRNPKVLEFDNKRVYFEQKLHKDDPETSSVKKMELNVRRDQVFLDSYRNLFFKPTDEVRKSRLEIHFKGEEGVDAGGVTREWYQVLARQMFDPNYALFTPVASDQSTFHPNRTSWVNPEHLSFFKFVGMIIGKAVYDGYMLDCHFSRAVFKQILGKTVSIKDMESLDLEYYKSLVWMLENNITDIIVETFSVETDEFGEHKVFDLIPDGRNIAVTEENKQEYVKLIVEYRLLISVKKQMDNFKEGFFSIIPKDLVTIFDEQELELLVSGLPDIDVDDWKANSTYENYSASSKQVQWFWRAVKSFDVEERAKLLQFATGTSKVPLNGFKELPGMNGISKFSVHRVYNSTDRLPTAHTCFNQIDLPEYESYTKLRNALLLAIREGHEGFGFA